MLASKLLLDQHNNFIPDMLLLLKVVCYYSDKNDLHQHFFQIHVYGVTIRVYGT